MRVSTPFAAVLSGVAMLALGACADNRSTHPVSAAPTPTQQMSATFYRTMNSPAHGEYYATNDGMTLYYYRRDPMGASMCYDNCAMQGRPYMAPTDARASGEWTVVARRDGARQWAFRGRPVYTWHGDRREGDVTGNGEWMPVATQIR